MNTKAQAIITRFDFLGNPDPGFNNGRGVTLGSGFGSTIAQKVVFEGGIFVAGINYEDGPGETSARRHPFVLKLTLNGSGDYYGNEGIAIVPLPNETLTWQRVSGFHVARDFSATLCGTYNAIPPVTQGDAYACYMKLDDRGALDDSFGADGVILARENGASYGMVSFINGIAIGGVSAKPVAQHTLSLGYCDGSTGEQVLIHHVMPVGHPLIPTMTAKDGGCVYVAGMVDGVSHFIARFKDNAIDTSFGNNGIVVSRFSSADITVTCIHVSPKGIYLGGHEAKRNNVVAVAKYLLTGKADTGFSGDGKMIVTYKNLKTVFISGITVDHQEFVFLCGSANHVAFLAAFNNTGDVFRQFGEIFSPAEPGTLLTKNFQQQGTTSPSAYVLSSITYDADRKMLIAVGNNVLGEGTDILPGEESI